jgi:hypothetical protein
MTYTPPDPDALKGIRKAIQDIKLHDHNREDWFCMNLTSWLGERSGWLVARLDEATAEVERLSQFVYEWANYRKALIELHEFDELVFGGFVCTRCSTPYDPDLVAWPCDSLRAIGVTDEDAREIILAHRASIERTADAGA